MERVVLVIFTIAIVITGKKQDVVRISAEIKRREIANSNPLICDMPANDQAVAQKIVGDAFMMGAQVAHNAQDHLNNIKRKGM